VPGIAAALALLALLAPQARAANQQVFAADNQFVPPAVAAGRGDTLTFVNTDIASHNVTSVPPGLFGTSGNVAPGTSGTVQGVSSLKPGSYRFVCTLHPGMSGILQVGTGLPGLPPLPPLSPNSLPNPVDYLPKVAPAPLTGSEWPFYGRDLANSRDGGSDGPSWNEVLTMGPVWTFESTDGDFTGTPVVAGGTLVAAAFGGSVFGLDASTGARRWVHDFDQPINGSAGIADGRVFVPLAKPSAPAIAALRLSDGAPLWQTTIDSQRDADVYGSPVVWDGRVYIGVSGLFGETSDPNVHVRGAVVALDAQTGRVLWKTYTVPPGNDGGAVWDTPAIDTATGRLYAGTGNAYHKPAASTTDSMLMLDARTGALLAHRQATPGDVWNETSNIAAGPDADFGASPQLIAGAGGRLLVGDGEKSGHYWAFDRSTLRTVWNTTVGPGSFAGGILGSTAYDGVRIYGPNTPAGEIWSLTTRGTPAWVSSDVGPIQWGPVSVANGIVYSADMAGVVTARDAATGLVLARLPIGRPAWGGVAIAGGYVFAATGTQGATGWIVAFRPRG
jgi:polyvinyl alcohol dehydrogenase (cytochrome)